MKKKTIARIRRELSDQDEDENTNDDRHEQKNHSSHDPNDDFYREIN